MSNPNLTVRRRGVVPGILCNRADRRSLFWALGLFPLPILVATLWPISTVWILPLTIYLAFCAGVLTHYHNHKGVFRNRTLNQLYSLWLSIFYGFPIFSWIPTHNQNHHKHTNGPMDATSTFRSGNPDSFLEALIYPIRSSGWQLPVVVNYLSTARSKQSSEFRWLVAQATVVPSAQVVVCVGLVHLHGWKLGGFAYVISTLVPALLAPYLMMFINYLQHVGSNPGSADDHSRNFVGRPENWLVFEAGLHTVHHEHPGTHWSEYPRLHSARGERIAPILNQRNVFSFLWNRYVLRRSDHILLTSQPDTIDDPANLTPNLTQVDFLPH